MARSRNPIAKGRTRLLPKCGKGLQYPVGSKFDGDLMTWRWKCPPAGHPEAKWRRSFSAITRSMKETSIAG